MKLFICQILLAFIATATAQPPCHFTRYTGENGLQQKAVMRIIQDRRGLIWLAT